MSAQSVYSSTDAEVLAAMDRCDAEQAAFSDQLAVLRAEFGVDSLYYSDSWGWRTFSGFGTAPQIEGVSFKHSRQGLAWPKQTTKPGKELHARLSDIRFKLRDLPGMPASALHDMTSYTHGMARFDGVVWVTWGCSHDVVEGTSGRVDLDRWVRRRLSEYHVAREAAEAAPTSTTSEEADHG